MQENSNLSASPNSFGENGNDYNSIKSATSMGV